MPSRWRKRPSVLEGGDAVQFTSGLLSVVFNNDDSTVHMESLVISEL